MNSQSIEILNAIVKLKEVENGYNCLVITHSNICSSHHNAPGSFLSFSNLTSEDFFEIYRYKKRLEEDKDKEAKSDGS